MVLVWDLVGEPEVPGNMSARSISEGFSMLEASLLGQEELSSSVRTLCGKVEEI